jgi:hypothetical protein
MKRRRQSHIQQITSELLHILQTVNNVALQPRVTLADIGIVVFPGTIAIELAGIAKLMGLTKSSFSGKLAAAQWKTEVFCPSIVKAELKQFVGDDIRRWTLRAIPSQSAFETYVEAHPELVTGKDRIPTQESIFPQFEPVVEFSEPVILDL